MRLMNCGTDLTKRKGEMKHLSLGLTTYKRQCASCPYCIKQICVFGSLQGSGSFARKAFDLQFIHGE